MTPNNQLAEPVAERAEMPAIKRLEWQEPSKATNGCWTAKSPLGTYSVVNEDGWYACRDDVPRDFYFEWSWRDMSRDNLLTAQAACQADFEARIRSALASPAAISGDGSGAVAVAEEATAGLCPRCAGTGRDPSTTALQCCKCMGSGAVVLRSALTVEPQGEAVPVARNLRQIVYDALDLSDELRSECADAVVAALAGSSHP